VTGLDGCAGCGRQVQLKAASEQGPICSNCASIRNSADCSRCGERRRIAGIDPAGGRWCDRCRNRHRREDDDRQRRELIIAAARYTEPQLDGIDIAGALARAAGSRRALRWLADHVNTHPQVLTIGPTSTPPVLDRFVNELVDLGAVTIRTIHPHCSTCRRQIRAKTDPDSDARRCAACSAQASRVACGRCGVVRRPYRRDSDAQVECVVCARVERRRDELDGLAAAITELVARTRADIAPSVVVAAVDVIAAQPHVRRRLHDQLAAGGLEHETGEVLIARLVTELRGAGVELPPPVCEDCRGPAEPLTTYRGLIRCRPCVSICPQCQRPVKEPYKPCCDRCRPDPQRPLGTCIGCRQTERRLDGDRRCRPCRERHEHRCSRCAEATSLTATPQGWLCHRCVLADELDTLLGPHDHPGFARLRGAVLAADNPQQIRRWLAAPDITETLAALSTGRLALDHASLDVDGLDGSLEHLRALLVASGLLPDVDRSVERFQAAAGPLLERITAPTDQIVVRTWLSWRVEPRLRRRVEHDRSVAHSAANARATLITVVTFLEGLHASERTLADCRQNDIDRWFAQPGAAVRQLRPFLAWARKQRHLPSALQLPESRSRTPAPPGGNRAALAHRLLTATDLTPDDRVAGALVVFYAQPATRIAALTRNDLTTLSGGTVTITLAGMPVELIEPFATLAQQLPIVRTNGVADQLQALWLFPGRRAGCHISADALGGRLRAIAIPPRLGRTTALSELALEIPPAVLAELVGVTPNTAARWATISGGDWASYAASGPATRTP
jgi:hypothetical protein